jgi:hypothetical protein
MTDYKTRHISHTLEDLLEIINGDQFFEALAKRVQGIQYEADMIKYDQDADEIRHGWEIERLHVHLAAREWDGIAGYQERTISDRNTAALHLGKAILDALEQTLIEPRFRDGYGDA